MAGYRTRLSIKTSLIAAASALGGCSVDSPNVDVAAEPTASTSENLGKSAFAGCSSAVAGGGWDNAFIPETTPATGAFTIQFRARPVGLNGTTGQAPVIDGVVGLSDGPADAFNDLGPIVQFNENGNIAARDGDHYVSGGFPYRTSDAPYEFQLAIDLSTHRYSAWVRHLDAIGKSFELVGADLAFRTQQSSVARLDNIGTFVDSENGHLDGPCGFSYTAATACVVSSNAAWVTQQFRPQAGRVGLEFLVTPSANGMDAVVGAAAGQPAAFSDLAAIVRFRPDGGIDARNGSAYAAEATATYLAGRQYRVSLDIDQPSGTYSASVTLWNDAPIVIAQNYAFRTEQAGVTLLDHVGQFVDETDGALQVCMLTVVR